MRSSAYSVAVCGLGLLLCAGTAVAEKPLPGPDKQFVTEAAKGGMTEVKMGELARQKGQSDGVKSFGETLIRDHSKANEELKQVAGGLGLSLPDDISTEQKKHLEMLQKLEGEAFDKAFVKHMVTDHKKDIAEFRRESQSSKTDEIKQFAGRTLPALEEHLKIAQDLSSKDQQSGAKSSQ
ncbi:MAG: DUF4142 domain-containing protein [Bdellovibrionota bacterium]